jgi:hypothetical protein
MYIAYGWPKLLSIGAAQPQPVVHLSAQEGWLLLVTSLHVQVWSANQVGQSILFWEVNGGGIGSVLLENFDEYSTSPKFVQRFELRVTLTVGLNFCNPCGMCGTQSELNIQ